MPPRYLDLGRSNKSQKQSLEKQDRGGSIRLAAEAASPRRRLLTGDCHGQDS